MEFYKKTILFFSKLQYLGFRKTKSNQSKSYWLFWRCIIIYKGSLGSLKTKKQNTYFTFFFSIFEKNCFWTNFKRQRPTNEKVCIIKSPWQNICFFEFWIFFSLRCHAAWNPRFLRFVFSLIVLYRSFYMFLRLISKVGRNFNIFTFSKKIWNDTFFPLWADRSPHTPRKKCFGGMVWKTATWGHCVLSEKFTKIMNAAGDPLARFLCPLLEKKKSILEVVTTASRVYTINNFIHITKVFFSFWPTFKIKFSLKGVLHTIT